MNTPNIGRDLVAAGQSQEDQEPKGAKNLLYFATQALNAKDANDHTRWQAAKEQLKLAADEERVTMKKKNLNEVTKLNEKIQELTAQGHEKDLSINSKAFEETQTTQISELIKSGSPKDIQTAFFLLSMHGNVDGAKYETMAKTIARDLITDDRFKQIANVAQAGVGEKGQEVALYEWIVRGVEQQRNGGKAPKQSRESGTPPTNQPTATGNQQAMPTGQPTAQTPQPIAPMEQGWGEQDYNNWANFTGQAKPGADAEMPTDKVQELSSLIEKGMSLPEAAKFVYGSGKPDDLTDAEYMQMAYNDLWQRVESEQITAEEALKQIGYLSGNKDVGQGRNFASDPDPSVAMLPPRWKQAVTGVLTSENKSFGTPGNDTMTRRIVEIENDPKLDQAAKDKMVYPLLRTAIERDELASRKNEINGMVDLFDHITTVEQYLKRHPSGIDPESTGAWQNAILEFFKTFGLTFQDDLAALDTIQDLNTALFVKAISGAQVTDQEREFLSKIMTQTKDGHKLSQAKIEGLRYFVGKRLNRYYSEKMSDPVRGLGMTEYLLGSQLPEGDFTSDGEFVKSKAQKPMTPKQTGQLGEVEGMQSTQPQGNPEFMGKWNGYTRTQRKQFVQLLIKKNGEEAARKALMDAGVSQSDLSKILSQGKK